jgi:hypothetical protein
MSLPAFEDIYYSENEEAHKDTRDEGRQGGREGGPLHTR